MYIPRMRRVLLATFVFGASTANAHFHLDAPASITTQDATGDPQKVFPCGPVNISDVPSGEVTNVMTGSMLTVTIDETINHPGHYRIALATDAAGLPAEPPVTQVGADPCGSAPIDPNPVMPVLADGLFTTASTASGPQSVDVQLPAGFTCQNCVLQVLQFMSSHPKPCFYHHCAALNISDNPPPQVDGAPTPGQEAGVDPPGGDGDASGGCCSSSRGAPSAATLGLLVLGLVLRRRRR